MDSNFDKLLENDDRYKLFIYQILQIKKESGIAIGELKQQVDLSDFKFNQLLDELKRDLEQTKSQIDIEGDKFLVVKNFSSKDYQQLRLAYFKKSVAADFLIKIGLFESISLSEFADLHFISSSSVYRLQTDLNEFLLDYELRLKSAKVDGDERNIRSFYFQLLFNYYGGTESPFSERIQIVLDDDLTKIEAGFSESISQVKESQLNTFLGIQQYRIKNNHFIKNKVYTKFELPEFLDIFKVNFSLRDIPINENAFLHLYLMLNDFLPFDSSLQIKETTLEKMIIDELEKNLQVSKLSQFENIKQELHIIAQRWSNFKLTTTTFISTEQLEFFEQSYPSVHELIYKFTLNLNKVDGYKLSNLEKNSLYYEFMFGLLSFNEIKNYEKTVKIFVDFSGGRHYNHYICENIEYFRYLNIQLTDKLAADTDIYISDFSNIKVNCHQIIWKTPPLDSDWEEFADTVVVLKGGSYE